MWFHKYNQKEKNNTKEFPNGVTLKRGAEQRHPCSDIVAGHLG
jgi:hypothetical protein